MLKLVRRFFEDIHRIATLGITVTLSPEDRTLLANFHRRRPSVKKEAA